MATAALTGTEPTASATPTPAQGLFPNSEQKSLAAPAPTARPTAGPDTDGADIALGWCLTQQAHRHPCPPPGNNGRNAWLTKLAKFCNERGVPLADLLTWAESAPELAGHNSPVRPHRIAQTVTGIYRTDAAKHNRKPFTAPTPRAAHLATAGASPRAGARTGRGMPTGPNGVPRHLPALLEIQAAVRARTLGPIRFAEPLIRQYGEGVIWPGTVSLIQGQAGSHKSRLAALLAAVVLAHPHPPEGDPLGYTFHPEPDTDYRLCYVDTERNLDDQLPAAMQSIQHRAGYPEGTEPPPWFYYTSLVDVERAARFAALGEFLEHVREGFAGRLFVVLDVLTDCCENFNDERDSLRVLDELNRLSNRERATFVAVIHENPGSLKARGHLGTEGTNKASTVLHVGYVKDGNGELSEVLELKYLKRRDGAPGLLHFAQYDPDIRGLTAADPADVATLTEGRGQKAPLADVKAALPELLTEPLPAGELVKRLSARLDAGERTIRQRLSTLLDDRAGLLNAAGELCRLTTRQDGKAKLYELAPINLPGT